LQANNQQAQIQRAKNGDLYAFEALIKESESLVYAIAYRMLANPEDAKDISQEVFIKAYKNIHKFDEKSTFSTWIYRIAVNTCIDELRKRKQKQTVSIEEEQQTQDGFVPKQFVSQEPSPEDAYLILERNREVMRAIHALSEEHKTIITLRDLNGLSYTEISEITNLSLGTVKSRLARARTQLKNEILKNREQTHNISRLTNQKGGSTYEM
jgi:RNA polymerase sigma-70 factor (ECF subfamily)